MKINQRAMSASTSFWEEAGCYSSGAREFLDLSYCVHALGFFPLLIHFARAGKRGAAIHAPR
jgi:hypothetical protein